MCINMQRHFCPDEHCFLTIKICPKIDFFSQASTGTVSKNVRSTNLVYLFILYLINGFQIRGKYSNCKTISDYAYYPSPSPPIFVMCIIDTKLASDMAFISFNFSHFFLPVHCCKYFLSKYITA